METQLLIDDFPTPNEGKRYSKEEEDFLRREYGKSTTREIAIVLGRSTKGISARARRLKLNYFDIPEDIPEGHKFCIGCGSVLPLDEFAVMKRSKDGKTPNCKCCVNKKNSERWLKQKEKRILSAAMMEDEQAKAIMAELSTQKFVCIKCKEEKLGSEFSFDKNRMKLEGRCKCCKMENNLENKIKRIKNGSDW